MSQCHLEMVLQSWKTPMDPGGLTHYDCGFAISAYVAGSCKGIDRVCVSIGGATCITSKSD